MTPTYDLIYTAYTDSTHYYTSVGLGQLGNGAVLFIATFICIAARIMIISYEN